MKIVFKKKSPEKIIKDLEKQLEKSSLSELVSFELETEGLNVKITKLGTSNLYFLNKATESELIWVLEKESLAFAHKPFRAEIIGKIVKMIEGLGGSVTKLSK